MTLAGARCGRRVVPCGGAVLLDVQRRRNDSWAIHE